MEVRQRPRPTNTETFEARELQAYLDAFGDESPSLDESIRVLDRIVVDYIIETCHEAEKHASIAGRQKVKSEDFEWMLREDQKKLARVYEMRDKDRELKRKRKAFAIDESDLIGKEGANGDKGKRGRKKKDGAARGQEGADEDLREGAEGELKKKRKYNKKKKNGLGAEAEGSSEVDAVQGGDDAAG